MELLRRTPVTLTHSISLKTGLVTSIRNHVKMYPWRAVRYRRECYLDSSKTPYTDKHNVNEFFISKKQRKDWQKVIPKDKDNRFNSYKWNENYRSDPVEARNLADQKMQSLRDSLLTRGSARETTAYTPPHDVHDRILALVRSGLLEVETKNPTTTTTTDDQLLALDLNEARALKFSLISSCVAEFNHLLPSSCLNDIETVQHLVEYFSTPVRGMNSYDALQRQDSSLPQNLTLIPEPIRYDRHNDDFFGGYNALPGVVSKVPGLRGAKKFPVLNQDEFQWPDI